MENEPSEGLFSDNYNDDDMFKSNSAKKRSPSNEPDFLGSLGKKSQPSEKKSNKFKSISQSPEEVYEEEFEDEEPTYVPSLINKNPAPKVGSTIKEERFDYLNFQS